MTRETILDIGIGRGGKYLKGTSQSTLYVGIDPDLEQLESMVTLYPNVSAIAARAQQLPFADSSIDKVVFNFPWKSDISTTWFKEFVRVLKNSGICILLIDPRLAEGDYLETADQFFTTKTIFPVSSSELSALGTPTALYMIEEDDEYSISCQRVVYKK